MTTRETDQVPDHPGVALHPPLFYLSALAISWVLNKFAPLPLSGLGFGGARLAGVVLLIFGLGIVIAGRQMMIRHGTNINPTKPTTAIIQTGPYRFSRNPLYLALTITYCGIGLLLNTWWAFLLLPIVLVAMHFLVVRREGTLSRTEVRRRLPALSVAGAAVSLKEKRKSAIIPMNANRHE